MLMVPKMDMIFYLQNLLLRMRLFLLLHLVDVEKPDDMVEIFEKSNVDAALAASIFHYDTHGVKGVKSFLKERKIPVRL